MNDLYTVNYKDEGPMFLSNFGQITRCVRIHGVHNEEAIDRNTEAIIEQTEMQKSESDESQIQFSGHSMMLERESNESQELFERESDEMQELFERESDEMQELYERETDETHRLMSAHTKTMHEDITAQTHTMKAESDETQEILRNGYAGVTSAITAQTKMQKDESDETQGILTDGYAGIKDSLLAHTQTMKNMMSANTETIRTQISNVVRELSDISDKIEGIDNKAKLEEIRQAINNLNI